MALGYNRNTMQRSFKLTLILLLLFLLAGCSPVKKWYYCGNGHKSAQNENHEKAIDLLDTCLEIHSLSAQQQAFYLQARAWAQFSLENFQNALRDQEKSFELIPPTSQKEYINHAAYLRMTGNLIDSLKPLLKAEALDEIAGQVSMLTQYNLGWSLYELGRYSEAISAFTSGISDQPDYPFVYFRRGLAYDKIDRVDQAESDFIEFVSFFENEDKGFNDRFSGQLIEASQKYSELKVLLTEAN
jgi:tetratricopeptide (TPR) repeat protein